MLRILYAAILTGTFCAVFAVGVDWLTEMLGRGQMFGISFVSGFLGSIFAQSVLSRWHHRNS